MKRIVLAFIGAVCLASAVQASKKDEVTLILVPREDRVVQIGLDIASRYPSLLVSYKVIGRQVSFHGWTGKEWVNIKPADYAAGGFFRTGPGSALIIEKENGPELPEMIIPSEDWCEVVYRITTTEPRPLLHLAGQYFDFKYKEWDWFSKNYNISMEAINPDGLNVAWYHKRLQDHVGKHGAVGADDLQYFILVRKPEEPVEQQPLVEEGAVTNAVESAEQPQMEIPEDPEVVGNPFTNEAPEAMIMGAAVADEDSADNKKKTE